ncbi:unnamed protein product [Euphydryas editha]|uniref:DDE-1 domain-containing protein n=1 Tax=Euphydryas editha TaxID=104508 RepID=A0AAU9TNZ6_EUPED|nr:unnamed protein product [Euphydryas editha]
MPRIYKPDPRGKRYRKYDENIINETVAAYANGKFSLKAIAEKAEDSPDTIKEYFKELEESLANIDPSNIINYDETSLTDDPGRRKIISKRGTKYPERVMNSSKSSVSLMMAATADGNLLPPYVVYKAQNLYNTWTENGPPGARYNRTLSANSTHLTQPLDVAFFRPMKIAWRNVVMKWKKTDGKTQATIPKGCFPELLNKLMEELRCNSKVNIIAGFRKTGIYPINEQEVLRRLPEVQNNENKTEIEKSVLELLKEMRYGTMNITESKRK